LWLKDLSKVTKTTELMLVSIWSALFGSSRPKKEKLGHVRASLWSGPVRLVLSFLKDSILTYEDGDSTLFAINFVGAPGSFFFTGAFGLPVWSRGVPT
jgi:hypothetical protein